MSTTRSNASRTRAGYVLTGVPGSRLGGNPAFVDVEGMPMAAYVARRIAEVADSVVLVGPTATYGDLGFRVIEDGVDDFRPAASLLTALKDSAARHTLAVACDLPNLRREFLERLFRRAACSHVDVVTPLSPDGREQPLCCVYGPGAVEALTHAVEKGISDVASALGGLSKAYLLPPEYADIDPSGEMLLSGGRGEGLVMRR